MKKKILALFIVFVMILSITAAGSVHAFTLTPIDFADGDGSAEDPYQIDTPEQLDKVRDHTEAHFVLANDIDLTQYLDVEGAGYNEGKGWVPIVSFSGDFDGNGKIISGLFIHLDEGSDSGLFADTSSEAVISRVVLAGVNITGDYYVGGLVGYNRGTIMECSVSGSINGDQVAGGLVGGNTNIATISDSHTSVTVSGIYCVGGLAGENDGYIADSNATGVVTGTGTDSYDSVGGLAGANYGTIENSYATTTVTGIISVGGLTGYNTGTIDRSYASGAVYGASYVGGLVGWNSNAIIQDSYAAGEVSATGNKAGGLVGWSSLSTIGNSYASGAVSGREEVGGLVGTNNFGTIQNTYARGTVNGQQFVGGLMGWNGEGAVVNSYATGIVVGVSNVGGLIGGSVNSTITSSYYDWETTYQSDTGKGTPKSSEEMKQQSTFVGWDFDDIWSIIEEETYPYLQWETGISDSIEIWTAADLNAVRNNLSGSYKLMTDINLDVSPYNTDEGWLPIGDNLKPFNGAFDGNGYTITGLYINRPDDTQDPYEPTIPVSLFGWSTNAVIQNVTLLDVKLTGLTSVGSLVGVANSVTIVNSTATGTVTGESECGGLVGFLLESNINNSNANVSVDGNFSVGGLVGQSSDDNMIENSHAKGAVSGDSWVGGLVGTNNSTIKDSYATGTVTGSEYAGGLVGANYGEITGSYATGNVSGESDFVGDCVGGLVGANNEGSITDSYARGAASGDAYVGGLVGTNVNDSSIANSYATGGPVTGNSYLGGLVGNSDFSTITSSYYDRETTYQSDTGKGTPKSSEEMKQQATFIDWGFPSIWSIHSDFNDGYPFLSWQAFIVPNRPINDNFADRIVLSGTNGSTMGSNVGATLEVGEPNHLLYDDGEYGASVWWSWTASEDFIAVFDTIGSDFDTLIAVYTGDSLDSLVPIAGNDDSAISGSQSRVSFAAWSDVTYHIVVDGFVAEQGDIVLNWSTTALEISGGDYIYWNENEHFYREYSINGPILWEDARNIAAELTYEAGSKIYQGHLVTVTSQGEQGFVNNTFMGYGKSFWIGAYREVDDLENWQWVSGEEWGYTNWWDGEPSNRDNELYVLMWGPDGWWDNASSLSETTRFLVEYIPPQTYTVALSANPTEGGSVIGAGTYDEGSSVTVIATANAGYRFVNWTEDGVEVSTLTSYQFNIEGDRTLVANFEAIPQDTYNVTLSAIPPKAGSVSGEGSYREGDEVMVTAEANEGFLFIGWYENGVEVSTTAEYTFTMGAADCNLTARFQKESKDSSIKPDKPGKPDEPGKPDKPEKPKSK